jgi:putative ABC transport system permease protein
LPLEIGGVDYRPVNAGAYLQENDLPRLKTIFWHNNIVAFAPILEAPVQVWTRGPKPASSKGILGNTTLIGTWSSHRLPLPDGNSFVTGVEKTNPWWHVAGEWFSEAGDSCLVGEKLARRWGISIGDSIVIKTSSDSGSEIWVSGILSTAGPEDDAIVVALPLAQGISNKPSQYRKLYMSALTKPEDDFARRDPKTMKPDEFDRWSCSPYVSSIAYSIRQVLPGADVRVIRRVAEGEGQILTRVRMLLWLVTGAALLAAVLAVGASSAASVIERRTEIGLMKALGAGSVTVGFLLAAEQLLLAFAGGGAGYALGIILARLLGERIFGAAPEPSLIVFFVIIALAAGVTILGSALPLHRASRYEPAPILRGE